MKSPIYEMSFYELSQRQNLGAIGSAVYFTFIGNKQTDKQTIYRDK